MLTLTYIKLMNALYRDRRGVTAVEYAVVAGVIVTAIVGAFGGVATKLGTTMASVVSSM